MKNAVATLFVGLSLLTAVPANAEEALWQRHSHNSAATQTVDSAYQEVGFRRSGFRRSGFRRGGFGGGFRRGGFGRGFRSKGFRRRGFGKSSFGRGFRRGGFRRSSFGRGFRRGGFGHSGFGFISPGHQFDQFNRFDRHHNDSQVFDGQVKAPLPNDVQAFEADGSLFHMPETQLQTINPNEGLTPQAVEDSASSQSLQQQSSTAQ